MSEENNYWEGKHFSFFQNLQCEFFPCHRTDHPEDFNCLFCYCPLFALGSGCGGNYKSIEGCAKDCSDCLLPHSPKAFGYITGRFPDLLKLAEKNMTTDGNKAAAVKADAAETEKD